MAPITRIVIYGVTGSGKTTLARRVAAATGLPFYEVDALAWRPGWEMVPLEEQIATLRTLVPGEKWIFDSMYGKWLHEVQPHAQLIVGLDYSPAIVFFRLLFRTMRRVVCREICCNGNIETLRQTLSRDSILVWQWRSFRSKRARLRKWAADPNGPPVVLFRHPREAAAWLRQVEKDKAVNVHGS